MAEKRIEIEDLLKYRFPENLQYSPEGTWLAFQLAQADEKNNSYTRDVWIIADGKPKQLTANMNASIVCWDDETHLILTRDNKNDEPGDTQLYKIDVTGGEAQKWLKLPPAVRELKKVSDDTYVFTAMIRADDPDAYLDSDKVKAEKAEQKKKDADYQVIDEIPYWFNGAGYINGTRTALFVLQTGEKNVIRRITSPKFSVGEFTIHKNRIWYTGNTKGRSVSLYDKVFSYDLKTKKTVTEYKKNDHSIYGLTFLKGQLFVSASDMKEYGVNETPNICRLKDGELQIVRDPLRSLYESIAGDTMLGGGKQQVVKNDVLYTLATDEDHVQIRTYDAKMKEQIIFDEPGGIFFLDVSDTKIAYARETESSLCEIFEMNLDGSGSHQLTECNTAVLENKYVALPQRVDYTSGEEQLHGWVLLPQNFSKKKTYPAILDVHGGPRGVYGEMFFHEMQVWAARGFVVMYTNIRGSDGRDDAFADIRGKYGYVDFDNLMDFTDAVLAAYPNIDQNRVCETGGSYGGFMTNWIITHTDRFCAAASQRSISNWISMSFLSDIGPYFGPDQCGGNGLFGDENIAKLWEHSPLKYADRVKTPTLFIHSDEDFRCPLPEGMQMMQALAFRNIETKMVIFKGENHELSRGGKPLHRIRRLKEITEWFENHTKQ